MKTRVSRRSSATPSRAEQQRRSSGGQAAAQLQSSERMVAQRRQVEASFGTAVQRAGPEEELQMKAVQRAGPDEDELPKQAKFATAQLAGQEEELLQGKFATAQLAGPEEELQGKFAAPVQAKAEPNRTGMPDNLKSGIESLSGMDMSSVRVHANSDKPAQLNAHAYAQGNDIHLAPGQEQHLPHEAWHVVQQRQGRVQATTQLQGVGINDEQALEAEADNMGARAQRMEDKRAG